MPLHIQEKLVGFLPGRVIPPSLVVSPDSRHFVCVEQDGAGKMRAVHDGEAGPWFDGIHVGTPFFSPDSQRFAYVAQRGDVEMLVVDSVEGPPFPRIVENTLCFSPDSRRVGYIAFEGDAMFPVIDGQPGERAPWIFRGKNFFSPNSQRVAYVAKRGENMVVVCDGVADEPVIALGAEHPLFTSDSSATAYVAVIGDKFKAVSRPSDPQGSSRIAGGKRAVMCGGTRHAVYDEIPGDLVLSPQGGRIAYIGIRGGQAYVNLDGQEIGPYQGVDDKMLVFSPDGQRFAFTIVEPAGVSIICDGVQSSHYKALSAGNLGFTPDGRVRYVVAKGPKAVVIIEGVEHPTPYKVIQHHTLGFSPDGQRIAYSARTGLLGLKGCAVIDGVAGDTFIGTGLEPPRFSPDSRRAAYFALLGVTKSCAFVDGVQGVIINKFREETFRFSPDGSFTVFLGEKEGRAVVAIDGLPGEPGQTVAPTTGTILRGSEIFFGSDRSFNVMTLSTDRKIQVLEVTVEG